MITKSMRIYQMTHKSKKFIEIERDTFWFVAGGALGVIVTRILESLGFIY